MGANKGNTYAEHRNKYAVLHKLASDPDITARECADLFDCHFSSVKRWAKEAGISLLKHQHPRVSHILRMKTKRRDRLMRELAVLQREIKVLRTLDPSDAYIKPKGRK
jgi:ribosomal protein L35